MKTSTEYQRRSAVEAVSATQSHWHLLARRPSNPLADKATETCLPEWIPSKSEIRGLADNLPVSFLPMEKVSEQGGLDLELTRPISVVWQGFTYFKDGDVLVAKITPCFENGKGALADGLENGIGFGTTELHVLRPLPVAEPRFLELLTRQYSFSSPRLHVHDRCGWPTTSTRKRTLATSW